jgi:hypothetical protein
MTGDDDRDRDFVIIQKSLTTAHIEIPDFEPAPDPVDPAPAPAPASSEESE